MRAIKATSRSDKSAKLGALPQPLLIRRAINKLDHGLAHRRRSSQVSEAQRSGIAVTTWNRGYEITLQ